MNATRWRRWALPFFVTTLVLWLSALVVNVIVFDGPTTPFQWLMVGYVVTMLVVLIAGDLLARREDGRRKDG